jgi:hypothetical protein
MFARGQPGTYPLVLLGTSESAVLTQPTGIAVDIHDVPKPGKGERLAADSYYHGVEFYYRYVTPLSGGK